MSGMIEEPGTLTDRRLKLTKGRKVKKQRLDESAMALENQQLRFELAELQKVQRQSQQAKDELKESEQRLKSVIDGSPIPAFVIGCDHKILFWNHALEKLSKIKPEEVIGTSRQWRAFYKSQRPCLADLLVSHGQENIARWYTGKCARSKLLTDAYEAIDFFPDLGRQGKWLRFTAAIIRNASGKMIGAIETLEDITRRKKAKEELLKAHAELEERVAERTAQLATANEALLTELLERQKAQKSLKETSDHLSLILESLPIISYTRQAEDNFDITFVSGAIEEITGYSPRCFLEDENLWLDRIHPDDRVRVAEELQAGYVRGKSRSSYRFRALDDSYRWFSDYWRIVSHPTGRASYIVGAWQDVTEDKKIRQEGELRLQQMIQSQKLTALGEVVAGVAHEINNPVSFIAYNVPILEEIWRTADELLGRSGASHPDWENKGLSYEDVRGTMIDIIQAFKIGAGRISRVVTGLKEFSRSDEASQKKPVLITDVIAGALVIVGAQIRRTVARIEQEIAEKIPPVSGHYQKIEQVIANLLINAHQAIPQGRKGRLVIRCRYIQRLKAVVVDIEDNGKGMERKTIEQIFDPFFTTRREHDGTGLGLSISYGLIKEHSGLIGVLSRPGLGSRFSLYFPVDGSSDFSLYPAILCIDSNVKYLKEIKANFFDAVVWRWEAGDTPEDVLNFLYENPEVDMLVSEIRLKSFDGWALMDQIKARYPLLPVILYSADPKALQRPPAYQAQPEFILRKPFKIEDLQKIIRELGRQRL